MKKIAIAALIGAFTSVILFGVVWLLCSFIALEWLEPYWALLRGMVGVFSFSAAMTTAYVTYLESDW